MQDALVLALGEGDAAAGGAVGGEGGPHCKRGTRRLRASWVSRSFDRAATPPSMAARATASANTGSGRGSKGFVIR